MTRRELTLCSSVNPTPWSTFRVVEGELERIAADLGGEAAPPRLLPEVPADLEAALTEQLDVGESTAN